MNDIDEMADSGADEEDNDSEPAGSDATLPVAGGVVDPSDGDCRDEEFDVGDFGVVDVSPSADATPGSSGGQSSPAVNGRFIRIWQKIGRRLRMGRNGEKND